MPRPGMRRVQAAGLPADPRRAFPLIQPQLIKGLRERFPYPTVTLASNREEDLWVAAQSAVVDFLEALMEVQSKTS